MKADPVRIRSYLLEIRKNSLSLNQLIDNNELAPESVPLKAAKYVLIELAESMSNTIQHILAKEKGVAVSGYIDTVVKGHEHGILSLELFDRLKPFFDFRNSLIHRYWTVDDRRLIENINSGRHDFERFIDEIESFVAKKGGL
ncbi:MAG: HepT-like ribonuclease domain-containing protein [Desulfosalsimonas sp.]